MGMTDYWIVPRHQRIIGEYINSNLKPGDKIAWLGQQQESKYILPMMGTHFPCSAFLSMQLYGTVTVDCIRKTLT